MSGTSADGIDAVVVRIGRNGSGLPARVLAHVHRPFASPLRRQILKVSSKGSVAEICELNFLLGKHFASTALSAIRKAKVRPQRIVAIGSHGQTIHHLPYARTPSTLQIGEPSVIAELTGIPVIADFRVRDMAAGGQGAPLVPYADWALFTHPRRPRIIQNIGGIANLTFLPPGADRSEVLAFDTGPGNMVIDAIVSAHSRGKFTFDRGGQLAARGTVSDKLLTELMRHPFLKRLPPKTTGREEFGEAFARQLLTRARSLRIQDLVATVTAFTAATIYESYRRFIFPTLQPNERAGLQVILGGGGAKNPVLRRFLAEKIQPAELLSHEDFGIANSAKEALAFAMLAYETSFHRAGNMPSATGARRAVILGKIVPA